MIPAQQHAQRIAELLHLSRNHGWTTAQTLELAAALKGQPEAVLAMGLLLYGSGLLTAARCATEQQRDVAVIESALAEAKGEPLQ